MIPEPTPYDFQRDAAQDWNWLLERCESTTKDIALAWIRRAVAAERERDRLAHDVHVASGGIAGSGCLDVVAAVAMLKCERDEARKAILAFGNADEGFDWAVLGRIDDLQRERDEARKLLERARSWMSRAAVPGLSYTLFDDIDAFLKTRTSSMPF